MVYRLQFDTKKQDGEFLIDADTRKAPVFVDGVSHTLQFGIFEKNVGADLSDCSSVEFRIHYDPAEAEFLDEYVDAYDITSPIRLTAWNKGSACNFEVALTDTDMEYIFPSGETELSLVLLVFGIVDEYETRLLGKGAATLRRNVPT